jgi:leucine dehydrogenase
VSVSTLSREHVGDLSDPQGQVAEPEVMVPGTGAPLGEMLVLCHDRPTGLSAAVAVDETTLGPGLGGVRWMRYPSLGAAAEEASRLARVMTLKNALAEIPYGGAKSVMMRQGNVVDHPGARRAQLLAFAASLRHLEGAYVPGVDMGTSVADLAVLATVVPWVSCNHEDPSPATALGVFHSIDAAVRHTLGRDLSAVRVTVQGAGHVGSTLADLLAAAVARRVNGVAVAPEAAHAVPCDVFAPCALARVLHGSSIDELDCAVVAGAANDVLAERSCAELLARRDIVYVPDFVTNAGGVVQIHAERAEWEADKLAVALAAIGQRTSELLDEAAATHTLPLHVAEQRASARLGHAITIPD